LLGRTRCPVAVAHGAKSESGAIENEASPRETSTRSSSGVLARGDEVQIRLVRQGFVPLGMRLAEAEDCEAWEILSFETGLVRRWNEEQPGRRLFVGDRITRVNGEDDLEAMERAFVEDSVLELTVWRNPAVRRVSL